MTYRAGDNGLYGAALRAASGDRQQALAVLGSWSGQGIYKLDRNGSPIVQDGQSLPWVDTGSMSAATLAQSAQRGGQVLSNNSATTLANAQSDSSNEALREMNRFAAMSTPSSATPVWNMRDASTAAMRGQTSAGDLYGSLAEGASNAQYVSAMLDGGMEAGGKAAGAIKLLPAGALQHARVQALMAAKDLEAAQGLIKGPTAKSALAMAEYGTKYAGAFKALPYVGATLSAAEEANRVYRAEGWQETTKVVAVGTGNYFADGAVTTGGAWAGAKVGAAGGAVIGSFVPVVGTGFGAVVGGVVGTVGGALGGHWFYDSQIAPEVRAQVAGEKFRDAN